MKTDLNTKTKDFFKRLLLTEAGARRLSYCVLLGLVLLSALGPFLDIPGYYFTDNDTLGVLRSARVHSVDDLLRILTESVKSTLVESRYYRPVMTLSFSLDFALWGYDPFGYHLTNLILHVLVAGLLFQLVYTFNDRDLVGASLAAFLYTLHPLLMDVVPAVVRRQETLMALFLLAGLLTFHRYEYHQKNTGYLLAALSCFVLSVGAKEIGILFAGLVPLDLWVQNPGGLKSFRSRTLETFKRSSPYVLTAVLYFFWWCYVTEARAFFGGAAGFERQLIRERLTETFRALFRRLSTNLPEYFRVLFDPFFPDGISALLRGLLNQTSEATSTLFPALTLPLMLVGLVVLTSMSLRWRSTAGERTRLRSALTGLGTTSVVALSGLAAFPLLHPFFDAAVERLYHSEFVSFIPSLMASRGHVSLATYQREYTDLFVTAGRQIVYWTGLPYLGIITVKNVGSWFRRTRTGRSLPGTSTAWFYGVWFLIPGLFYGMTLQSIGPQNMYIGILPLSALLATWCSDALPSLNLGRCDGPSRTSQNDPCTILIGWKGLVSRGASTLVIGAMVLSLLMRSPLANDYDGWRLSAVNNRISLVKLETRLRTLPPRSGIELLDVPVRLSKDRKYPHMRYLLRAPNFYFLMRWQFDNRNFRVVRHTFNNVRKGPEKLPVRLETRQLGSHYFLFVFRISSDTGGLRYLLESAGGDV